jgi:23S rRNA (cytidine1920-2'-O)/16S rRNA (cytidine1409-2'-O)-methyltransferase
VASGEPVEVTGGGPRFVSRGGEKLDAGLERFEVDVTGRRCLDAGASTGGFTDCLLQRGASHVTAVDVGYGQIHPKLRADPRVLVVERTNIRTLDTDLDDFTGYDVVVADLSFISLTTVAPVLAGPLAASEAEIVVLVKPQFEAGHREVSRGRGVVRDDSVRRAALSRVAGAFDAAGASIMGAMVSPIIGPAGNVEFLLYARAHFPTRPLRDVEEILDSAMTGAR